MDAETLFKQGVNAVKNKNMSEGQRLLMQSLKLDQQNATAWLWLARTFDDPQKRLKAVDRALQIDPDNELAKKFKASLSNSAPKATTAPTSTRTAQREAPAPSPTRTAQREAPAQPVPTGQAILTMQVMGVYRFVAVAWSVMLAVLIPTLIMAFVNERQTNENMSGNMTAVIFTGVGILLLSLWLLWQVRKAIETFRRKITLYDTGIHFSDMDELWDWGSLHSIQFVKRRLSLLQRLTPYVFWANTHFLIRHVDGRKVKIPTVYSNFGQLTQALGSMMSMATQEG